MKNATWMKLENTTSISFLDARRAAHLRRKGWRHIPKLAGLESCAVELLALRSNQTHAACYKVVGSSPSCSKIFFYFNV